MIHYSCIGATGYVCGEVLRMMVNHPDGELVNVLDTYGVGDAISTHHPALGGDRSRRRLPHHRHRRGHPLPRREGLGEVVRRQAHQSSDDP